jgi:hypothetical protein
MSRLSTIAFSPKKLYFKRVLNNPLTTMSNPTVRKNKGTKKPTKLHYSHRKLEEEIIPESIRRVSQERIHLVDTCLDLRIRELELELELGCPVE